MPKANIDIVAPGAGGDMQAHGSVAMRLMQSGFNINALRTNDVLRKDEWSTLDNTLIEIARNRLVAVNELVSRGLTYNIANGLGTTILEWEQVSDMEPAEVSMAGVTEGQRDILDFALQSMPLPIIHKDFNINIRKLEASRTTGQPLDLAQAEMAMRLVMEQTESMVFNGHTTQVGTSKIYGLTNEPNVNTGSTSANWDSAAVGSNYLTDILGAIDLAEADNMYGPYGVFCTQKAFNRMQNDFKAESDKTIMSRLMKISGIQFIKPSKDLAANTFVLFQLTKDVIDEVVGLQPTVVSWETNGGMTMNFKVMSIMIPRVRSTKTAQSGIAVYAP